MHLTEFVLNHHFLFYLNSDVVLLKACSTSLPSGNLVDGLPLVEHTDEDVLAPARIHNNVWDGHA